MDRALTPGEYLARAVAGAPAIAVGSIVNARETTVAEGAGSEVATFTIVTFSPEQWPKGGGEGGNLTVVEFAPLESAGTGVEVAGWQGPWTAPPARGRVIAFIRADTLSLVAPSSTLLGAARSVSWWQIWEGGSMYELPGFQPWTAQREEATRREVARQSPDSILARSDVVAVVRVPSLRSRPGPYAVLAGLRGAAPGDTLRTRLVWSFLHVGRDGGVAFLCLKRARDGVLEPVSMDAGVLALDGERIPAWRCTLADVRERLARLARPGPRRGR